jgi:hypothetical protein
MKRFSAAILVVLPFYANAADWHETCTKASDLAEILMQSRQKGQSMSEAMALAKGNEVAERMVIAAYDIPRFNSEEIKTRTISDFRDKWYATCVREVRGKR